MYLMSPSWESKSPRWVQWCKSARRLVNGFSSQSGGSPNDACSAEQELNFPRQIRSACSPASATPSAPPRGVCAGRRDSVARETRRTPAPPAPGRGRDATRPHPGRRSRTRHARHPARRSGASARLRSHRQCPRRTTCAHGSEKKSPGMKVPGLWGVFQVLMPTQSFFSTSLPSMTSVIGGAAWGWNSPALSLRPYS